MSVRYQDGDENDRTEVFEGENAMRPYDPDGIQVKAEPDPDEEDEFAGQPNIKDWKPDVDVTFKGMSLSFPCLLIAFPLNLVETSIYQPSLSDEALI